MKTILLSFLLVGFMAISMAQEKHDVMAVNKACEAESKATSKEIEDFWANVNIDNTSPNMKCQLKCVMEKVGLLKGGVFDAEKAAKDWQETPELKEFKQYDPNNFVSCKNERGTNDCETAFKIHKCVRQAKN